LVISLFHPAAFSRQKAKIMNISTEDYFLYLGALLTAHLVLILGFAIVVIRWFNQPQKDELQP